jgi:hypothetical protein
MSRYTEFYLNSSSSVVKLDMLTISHPDFTQVFNVVRNAIAGITVTLETSAVQAFEYYPLQITPTGSDSDLDQVLKITLGDLGQLLPQQLDSVQIAGTFRIKPTLIYRQYRSDDLTLPIEGPDAFTIDNIAFDDTGATFQASAPRVNLTGTGERYTFDRFPMLRGSANG